VSAPGSGMKTSPLVDGASDHHGVGPGPVARPGFRAGVLEIQRIDCSIEVDDPSDHATTSGDAGILGGGEIVPRLDLPLLMRQSNRNIARQADDPARRTEPIRALYRAGDLERRQTLVASRRSNVVIIHPATARRPLIGNQMRAATCARILSNSLWRPDLDGAP
jgi:hypothetical protein